MSPGPLEDYVSRLERELRRRGLQDSRILAETREHLVDAVEEGRQRGLSVDEAEQEALERFGAPGIVAAHVHEEGDDMTGFSGVLARVWQRKWWILAPTITAAIVTAVLSSYLLPTRYRAGTEMIVLARILPSTSTPVTVTGIKGDVERRIWALLGRTDLEEIIRAFDLYGEVRKRESLSAAVDRMRRDIRIESLGYRADGAAHAISVSFAAADAALAKQVTDRLASVLIGASLDQPTDRLDMTIRAFESRVAEMREQIIEHEARLAALRTENAGRPISEAELIPYEVLKEQYRNLLVRKLDAEVAENLERRQAGQQFRITDPARLPDSPDGPSRMRVTVIGALIGLLIGLALVVLRRSSDGAPPALAEA